MAEFIVKLADERGHISEQVQSATSAMEAQERFTQAGYLVYSVRPKSGFLKSSSARAVKLEPFVIFNQQFLTLFKAGLPILTALEILRQRQRDKTIKVILDDVTERVRTGESLSNAFTHHQSVPKIFTTTLMAGEKSGNLEEVLGRYISFQRVTLTFRKKLLASLVYPTLLIFMVSTMFIFLISFVVPKFGELYDTLGSALPSITVFMLALGRNVQKYLPAGLLLLIIIVVGFLRWKKTEAGNRQIDILRLNTPMLGDIWLKYQVAMFCRTLSTLLVGGLPLVPALETSGSSITSQSVSAKVKDAIQVVREGKPLSQAMEGGIVPDMAVEMIEVGEATGALPSMLNSVADFFEEDVQTALSSALSLIEPAILIIMGIVVATVLFSLYLPIFSLGANIQ